MESTSVSNGTSSSLPLSSSETRSIRSGNDDRRLDWCGSDVDAKGSARDDDKGGIEDEGVGVAEVALRDSEGLGAPEVVLAVSNDVGEAESPGLD